jgi:hypothetical protein
MWEIIMVIGFFIGALSLLCAVVCIAILMVIAALEAVDDYKRWRK